MKLQGRNLSLNTQGADVALLHTELCQLGLTIADAETTAQSFEASTHAAVQLFQKQHGLPPTGVVDARTATAINTEVDKLAGARTVAPAAVPVVPSTPPVATRPNPPPPSSVPASGSAGTLPTQPPATAPPAKSTPSLATPPIARPPEPPDYEQLVESAVLVEKKDQQLLATELQAAKGDWAVALASLKDKLPPALHAKVTLAHSVAVWSDNNAPVVKAFTQQPGVTNLRDVALGFNVEKLAALVEPKDVPASIAGATADEKKRNYATFLRRKLFDTETSAVLQRMVLDAEIPIADTTVRAGVTTFLSNQPTFNIRTTSVYTALKHPDAFRGIPEEQRAGFIEQLKTLQRVQALSPVPEAVPVLMNAKLTSAFQVGEMPESAFLSTYGAVLGEDIAVQVYTSAINVRIRNEHALIAMRESVRGTGLAIIDGKQPLEERKKKAQQVADKNAVPLDLETLFGSMDECECGECTSVYSAASYFVELLQFLRNNNLGPDPKAKVPDLLTNPNIHAGIAGTPLEKLFRRRPDLGCLELTCENTNTVLPYIDLVNEVMESFVVHLKDYANAPAPKQTKLAVFNVEDEISSELLAQPQHINYQAYCILKNAVYPFTLPYHQPIDASRIFLKYLGTSRCELLDTYRTATETCDTVVLTAAEQNELQELHVAAQDRAVDAEFLGITQEEYIILVKEVFWPKRYFEITQKKTYANDEYHKQIGVKPVHVYYGNYGAESEMLSTDEVKKTGLTFVKEQFLKRTGVQYVDLVELLKTRFINPNLPQGTALTLMESLRFSYRFLQTLVVKSRDPNISFKKLIDFLVQNTPLISQFDAMLHPDPCQQQKSAAPLAVGDLQNWVHCYFERIGKLIVLESGTIQDGRPSPSLDTCDLDKVRLTHLDGTPITSHEYDRMHRFIRLWRNLGWTIDETDKALSGASVFRSVSKSPPLPPSVPANAPESSGGEGAIAGGCHFVGFDIFKDDCYGATGGISGTYGTISRIADGGCPDLVEGIPWDITPNFLHQLVAIRKLLDLTGLPLVKLLTFWADISTAGDKSLYSRLFLTHNLLGIDDVFQADVHGNYLTQPAKLTDHVPVLMAALKLKADDVTTLKDFRNMPDALTLANVSELYRHSLLARVLHVKVADLPEIITLFGDSDPFKSPDQALDLLDIWGKMGDAGFAFRQLNYLIRDHDDLLHPLAPPKKKTLQVTRTLYNGLNAIDHDHPDVEAEEQAKAEFIRAQAGLLFNQEVIERLIGLLEGTTVYKTNASLSQTIVIPDALANKLKYSSTAGALQVTGILTDAETTQANDLSKESAWSEAIKRAARQAVHFFDDVLFGIFSNPGEAKTKLLAGDVNVPPDPQNPAAIDNNTAGKKRFYFLQQFMPFLRQQLAHRLIVDALSGAVGLARDATDVLLSNVLTVATTPPQSAMAALQKIKEKSALGTLGWKGYLIPSADAMYTFIAISDAPAPLLKDGEKIEFPHQQDDPSNVWSSDPVKLTSGTLYWLEVTDLAITDQPDSPLQWKTPVSPRVAIPVSALLADYSAQGTEEVFTKLYKAALLVNGFHLTAAEISHFQTHSADFGGFDFNAVTMQHWKRLQAYSNLRDNLPKTDTSLLDLFSWAEKSDASPLSGHISAVTLWKQERIEALIKADHFDLNRPGAFTNEINLLKLQMALTVADKIGMDVGRLFEWAKPESRFWVCNQIAESIRKAIRARFDQEDWEQVVKPLNDELRENQKQALIGYLLAHRDLIDPEVVDADSLFEFFLIDVQMGACMETSRIKQAISTVQLFIQRCLLGLEAGVPNIAIDRDRWQWMQKYRVWEANRKVFLYPENWIRSELRDDKSPFYKELESELLQKDINKQTVEDALKSYLFKVDEVANLKVVGLFLDDPGNRLHVFGRTRNAPYFFYYRYFQTYEKNWYPWEKVQVDIPSYDVETLVGQWYCSGTYLIPVVLNKRLLIFFPQFVKKTKAEDTKSAVVNSTGDGGFSVPVQKPLEFWEIKMAWSEYRNGKWTQKQLSGDVVPKADAVPALIKDRPPCPVAFYQFIPRVVEDSKVVIDVHEGLPDDVTPGAEIGVFGPMPGQATLGAFQFSGSQLHTQDPLVGDWVFPNASSFHYTIVPHKGLTENHIYSLEAVNTGVPLLWGKEPYFAENITGMTVFNEGIGLNFYHPFAHELVGIVASRGLGDLCAYYLNAVKDKDDAYGSPAIPNSNSVYDELKRTYSLYNWEAAFHAPMQLADRLLAANQFDQALEMCHYVFDPSAKGVDAKRFWQFLPFRETDAENALENLFLTLQPGKSNPKINEWRNKPFQPHVVARERPSAYMKWVVMKYLEILIAYGDFYFRQNTLETIPMAIQCYVLAAHICGPRGQKIPKRGKIAPQTYNSLLDKWDAFGNAMVELELVFPFSNQTPLVIGIGKGDVGLANVFGFATSLYFCIPDNPQLTALRDTIDDRLFKIRHCEDIEGVFRQLPLFEPPIDPALLVAAAAQGLSLSSVLNDLNSPMPNYRFYYLLQKALEVCTELKALGNAFLAAKEKGDAEALAQMRARHESSIYNLVMEVKKQQLDEAGKSLEALQQSRKGPVYRLKHYLALIGDPGKAPDSNTDFSELEDKIDPPIEESGLKLSAYEKEEEDKASEAAFLQTNVGMIEGLANIFHALPSTNIDGKPMGVGTTLVWGFPNLAHAMEATARAMRINADYLSYQSASAARKGGFQRQFQDRIQQANVAGYEIKNIDKQMLTQQIRINIAQQEITNQQQQIDNAQEVEDFLRNKYTNQDLYVWMDSQIRTLYYQAYTLAYDLAKRAEKVFRFERGLASSNFIQFGYWDAAYDGLLAGERLYIGLKQLEAAYQEKRGYDYEVSKHVSLRQVNPLALLQLKTTGTCEFALPEVLFDMDHPGHYMRRIKSVALTVPCVVGPYTSLNCTLRLLEHKFRTTGIADKSGYPAKVDETDDRFSTVNVPITSIAVSSGQNDSGVFELNFKDERYIPFEGAGAISKWRIELPEQFQQFDYETISDVVMHLRYTAVEGGDKLKKPAAGSVQDYIKSVDDLSQQEGLFAAFDLRHDFPDEWYKATHPPPGADFSLTVNNLYERLPFFTKGRPAEKIQATDVYLITSSAADLSNAVLMQIDGPNVSVDFTPGPTIPPSQGAMKSFVGTINDSLSVTNWQITIPDSKANPGKLWLIVRYVLLNPTKP
jgi:Tc toxin complex TcA C-terminal TcB-binding domain/ABC toxin N-terminal region/Neuraminidase-like domain/Putative peptidoglycan binding domain